MNDLVFVESQSARKEKLDKTTHESALESVNKAKALTMAMWQGVGAATTEQMAEYYEVPVETVQTVLLRNKEEFVEDGLHEIKGKDLKALRSQGMFNLNIPEKTTRLNIWTPRSALRLGMLLRDSEVAKQVRTTLLDVVATTQPNIPTNFTEALRLALSQAEELEKQAAMLKAQEEAIAILEPKADIYDAIADADRCYTHSEIAKTLAVANMGQNKLIAFLRDKGILTSKNEPIQQWVNEGKAKMVYTALGHPYTVYTCKGLVAIKNLLERSGHEVVVKQQEIFIYKSALPPAPKVRELVGGRK